MPSISRITKDPVAKLLAAHHQGDQSAKAKIKRWHARFRESWVAGFSRYMTKQEARQRYDDLIERCIDRFCPAKQGYANFTRYVVGSLLGVVSNAKAKALRQARKSPA